MLVFVQLVIAAIITDPWFKVKFLSLNLKSTDFYVFSYLIPNPLNPTLLTRQSFQSFFISERVTLSWGLLGPDKQGSTLLNSNSRHDP